MEGKRIKEELGANGRMNQKDKDGRMQDKRTIWRKCEE